LEVFMSTLKYGIVIPFTHPRTAARLAQIAEEAGWDGIFVGDAIWTTDPLINLAAAAMTTTRIRLGTEVLAMPVRRPWHLASESLALDLLSEGRLILGLGMGATWMGWQGFPDFPTDVKTRNEMLAESVEILTRLHQSQQFDYDGLHYRVRLSQLDPQYYPPPTPQQPRVPVWIPAVWPRKNNVRRALGCDGVLPQKMDSAGQFAPLAPEDVRAMKAFIEAERGAGGPFDIVVEGKTHGLAPAEARALLDRWQQAGATWWIESTWETPDDALRAIIAQGPPR
jgi:alkanesulfonate monooxygenase SsuD/methylene tetrahydromethanopterin reductase-like flavin-dependent oxidoreductase (luciferase family)